MSLSVAIRTDASLLVGTGHVMRCLTLAKRLRLGGATVSFICRRCPGDLCDYVETQGFIVHRIGAPEDRDKTIVVNLPESNGREWLEGATGQTDAEQTIAILRDFPRAPDWLVVDHYGLDIDWERSVRPINCRLMVIDDLANRLHSCDLLLDQNFKPGSDISYAALVPKECRVLLGPRYALLRQEFREARSSTRTRDGQVRSVLIFLGGTDPSNVTGTVLEGVKRLGKVNVSFDVVIGSKNPHHENLVQKYASRSNITFHVNVPNMAELMAQCDLAIGAGGTTSWERCCMGLPSIVITVAENQEPSTDALARAGATLYLGRKEEVSPAMIEKVLVALCQVPSLVRYLSTACGQLVDGLGCERIAAELLHGKATQVANVAAVRS